MTIYNFSIRYSSAILILSLSCVEPYDIPTDPAIQDILVVDGFMNATEGTATITLSHVQHVEDSGAPPPETNARVSIASLTGEVYNLPEVTAGVYMADDLIIDTKEQYTLHVSTMNGKQYISETIRIYDTPAIDSLYVGVSNDGEGVNILLNTRDGKTRHYAWDYAETYEYNAPFYSGYKFVNHIPINRGPDDLIYRCWRTIASSSIIIASSVRLAEDIINAFPITTIPRGSRKTSVRYSIFVKQRTIGEEEYNYLYQLRKNLENIGGLFGVSPGTVTGNMREVNGNSVVLGYFSGAEVKEKRFFVRHEQLPDYLRVQPSREGCQVDTTCFSNQPPFMLAPCSAIENVSESSIVVSQVSGGAAGFAFTYTTPKCGDCRDHGGITQAPDFW